MGKKGLKYIRISSGKSLLIRSTLQGARQTTHFCLAFE